MSSTTTLILSSPLDGLGLPDDITRRIQFYHANPICDDEYFQYKKKERVYDKMCMGIGRMCPFQLLDMYACHLASFFKFSINKSRYEGFSHDSLFSRLEVDGGEQNWENGFRASREVKDDAHYSAKFLKNPGTIFGHKFITKYMWLCEFVQKSRHYRYEQFFHCIDGPKEKGYKPNMTMKKKELITLLDNNGIYFCKSWSKSKLVNAWYKST